MTRLETIKQIRCDQILKVMLTDDELERIKPDYIQFMNHKINLPLNVKKIILIKSIIMTKNKGNLPNAAYMRKVTESFIDEKAITLAKALEKMDRDKDYARKQISNNEPSWMDNYVKEIEAMEGNA
jgi:hypothetical protein